MFPTEFADQVIQEYTLPGDTVIDPFAGRGSAIFSAATSQRKAIGIEINPVGYVYANSKLKPCNQTKVINRLEQIGKAAANFRPQASQLPPFFHRCYAQPVREFLTAARSMLNWRRNDADRVLMALLLVSLHGKRNSSLSNQMRQSTAMAPDYCIRWWHQNSLNPPDIDPVAFMTKRIAWRYAQGPPETEESTVYLADSRNRIPILAREMTSGKRTKAKLLITSPPYHNVTSYYYDQWLRLWLLGETTHPNAEASRRYGGKFSNQNAYRQLLNQVFSRCRSILEDDATVCIRTDRRPSTYQNTIAALQTNFPEKSIVETNRPLPSELRTTSYSRGGAPKTAHCEVDLILTPK